jgi:transposase
VALSLTPGQAHDITQAAPLLDRLEPQAVLADKGYDADVQIPAQRGHSFRRKADSVPVKTDSRR